MQHLISHVDTSKLFTSTNQSRNEKRAVRSNQKSAEVCRVSISESDVSCRAARVSICVRAAPASNDDDLIPKARLTHSHIHLPNYIPNGRIPLQYNLYI